jgi:uncharacterized membrane protein YccC
LEKHLEIDHQTGKSPLILVCGLMVLAAPSVRAEVVLTSFGIGGTATFITDGTSNTIQFPEGALLDTCLDQVIGSGASLGSIIDGNSNTIVFGQSLFLTLR